MTKSEKQTKYDVVYFRNRPIRILREHGQIWLCLYDLCKIIKRPVMMETKEAMSLCPSSIKIVLQADTKPLWAIAPRDVRKLVHLVKKENSQMKKLCNELELWAGRLTENLDAVLQEAPVVFNYGDYPVTFKAANGKTMINATNMAKCFNGNPADWLHKASTTRFRYSLVNEGKSASLDEQVITNRGTSGGTWMQEELAMEYARQLSDEFSIWCNDCITELMTRGTVSIESMPPTRQRRADHTDVPPENFPVPKTFEEALLLAAHQQKQLEESRHKVEFYNRFIEDRDWFKTTTIADELQVTPSALNQFLEEEGIIRKEKGQWTVAGYHSALQCEVPYYWTNAKGKSYKMGGARRWTQDGREFIIELWNRKHIGK